MPDLADLPDLLDRSARDVLTPPLSGLRARSRRRRQTRYVGGALVVALVATPLALALPGHHRTASVTDGGEHATLDLYLQQPPYPTKAGPEGIRITGDPVVHLHVIKATVLNDPTTGEIQLDCELDPDDQAAYSAFGPGDIVANVIDGRLIDAPLFTEHIPGDVIITGSFTVDEAVAAAHELTDNVVVTAD